MDKVNKENIIKLYGQGYSIRKVSELIGFAYQRESIRKILKQENVPLRGRGAVYKHYSKFTKEESALFAEFLGYFYGDGCLYKYKCTSYGGYGCTLAFSLKEGDLVKRVVYITQKLFQFTPRVSKTKSNHMILFRKTLGRYLYDVGYPAGKKSLINPKIPANMLKNKIMKKHFICGFLNAEATVNQTIAAQQSVRVNLPKPIIEELKQENGRAYLRNSKCPCYFIKWSKIKNKINVKESNILCDLKELLSDLGISSAVYPIRLYIGKNDKTSVHYELYINRRSLKLAKETGIISQESKLNKLNQIL